MLVDSGTGVRVPVTRADGERHEVRRGRDLSDLRVGRVGGVRPREAKDRAGMAAGSRRQERRVAAVLLRPEDASAAHGRSYRVVVRDKDRIGKGRSGGGEYRSEERRVGREWGTGV